MAQVTDQDALTSGDPKGDTSIPSFAPITGTFGAVVANVDISAPIDAPSAKAIVDGLHEYGVLVFEGQQGVGPEQLLNFSLLFGEHPETADHPVLAAVPGFPGIKQVAHSGVQTPEKQLMDTWHTDGAPRQNTRYISILQAIDVPEYGRDTLFADMRAAYQRLSEPMKTFLDGLDAEHSWGDQKPDAPSVIHPLIIKEQYSGAKVLYANRMYTRSLVGVRPDESAAIMEFLVSQPKIPEFQLRVSWKPGTIVVWHNELVQHYVVFDRVYDRMLHRVMVC